MTVPLVVGTGLVALDVVFRGNEQEPVRRAAGGTCGNVLTILRFLGWKAVPVARLGDERAEPVVRADLERWGVDTRFLDLAPTRPTPIIVERVSRDDVGNVQHRYSWTCPCCGAWLPRYTPVPAGACDVVTDDLPSATVFFFDRPSRGAVKLAEAYATKGALIVFEPSAKGDAELFAPALALADVVKYSDHRFAALPRHTAKAGRLEIQTHGADGLRFRTSRGNRLGAWHDLPAIPAPRVIDTVGAGDWCTAGLLTRIAVAGREGFNELTHDEVRKGLRYGQALAAWNCGFEGARGGMYEQSRRAFERGIDALLKGAEQKSIAQPDAAAPVALQELCPACPGGTSRSGGAVRAAATHVSSRPASSM
jgi:sugar/nucleoside kinase (ribokinase family)